MQGVPRRRVAHGVGEVGIEHDERASLRGARGEQRLIGRPGEILNFGRRYVVPSLDENPASACTEIGVQLELHDA